MSSLQFNLDEDSLYWPISPDVIDISSNSVEEFLVEPGNVPQLEAGAIQGQPNDP